ncbi:MAG: HEPN domain-containing protein [Capsulimonadaceae bacterium]
MAEEKDHESWLIERQTAQNNWAQARSDQATALTLCDAGIYYAAVFFAQQAAEKALRAACIVRLQKNPRGHNIIHSANALHAPLDVMNAAAELNSDFLTSRTVEAAEGVPSQMYDHAAAATHLGAANEIVEWVRQLM